MLRVHAAALRAHVAFTGVKGKLWATFIPAEPVSVSPRVQQPRGVSIIARDFQTVALYKADGSFAGIRRPGSNKPIEV
jgi:cytochrome c biogenesis protein